MKRILLLSAWFLSGFGVYAQVPGFNQQNREKIQAARIAFLTNRLQLTSEQAQVFWPVFNEYEKEKAELLKKYTQQKRTLTSMGGFQNISDESASTMLNIYIEQKEVEIGLEKKYVEKFKAVLSPRQTWILIRSEGEFRRSLMDRLRNNRNAPNKNNRRRNGN